MHKHAFALVALGLLAPVACDKATSLPETASAPTLPPPPSLVPAAAEAAATLPTPTAPATSADLHLGLLNERTPAPNLITGGQPTPEQLKAAKAKGFTTVVNLRADGEIDSAAARATVEGLGMKYVSIPVNGADGLTVANAKAMAGAIESAHGPALVYCASGNRVGGLFALKAFFLDGKTADEAFALGRAAGLTHLEAAVRAKLVR